MKWKLKIIVQWVIILTFPVLAACSGKKQSGTPLPTAWPRLPVTAYDTMLTVSGAPVDIDINPEASARVVEGSPTGLTVTYPKAGAEIYYTFIETASPEAAREIIEARQERIGLNLGGVSAKTLHGTNAAGDEALLVVSTGGAQTPVQLLAVVPGYVVSATAFIHDPRASVAYDSIRPLVEVLQHDVSRTLKGFTYDER